MENLKWDLIGLKHTNDLAVGETAEAIVAAKLMAKGFIVSDPRNTTGYDLLSDYKGVINRVQVKSSASPQSLKGKETYYRFRTRNALGNFTVLVAYVFPKDDVYVIPWYVVKEKHMINIPISGPSKYDEYKENYEVLQTAN